MLVDSSEGRGDGGERVGGELRPRQPLGGERKSEGEGAEERINSEGK